MSELLESSTPWIEAGGVLLVGLLVAAVVAAVVNLGMRRLLRDQALAGRVAGWVFWLIAAIGFVVAVGRLAEPDATQTGLAAASARLLSSLPDLVIAVLVVVLGWAAATAVRGALRQILSGLRPGTAEILAAVAYWTILVLALLVAAEQVGIEVAVLRQLLSLLLGGLILAAALAAGLGTRGLVAEIVAGRHVEQIVDIGDRISVAQHEGVVVALGHASVRLATADGEVEIPNGRLLAEPVVIRARSGGPSRGAAGSDRSP